MSGTMRAKTKDKGIHIQSWIRAWGHNYFMDTGMGTWVMNYSFSTKS